ncbi:MAG: hypothetical protein GY778_18460, partial [bacterium]|nr:hypothetical protein [bacterium]
ASLEIGSSAVLSNVIQAFEADGIQVGSDSRVNQSGEPYYYVAWEEVAGTTAFGTYSGNGTDNRAITDVGFEPDYVLVKVAPSDSVHRPDSLAGDNTLGIGIDGAYADGIQQFLPTGFEVGTHVTVNWNGFTFYYAAFNADAAPSTYSISGTVFEDIAGDVLNDGAIGDANNPGVQNVVVNLYRDIDGDGVAEASDPYVNTVITAVGGSYSFAGLSNGKYWVIIESKLVRSTAIAVSYDDIWAEQTYGPGISKCADGAGGTANKLAGPCYGGRLAGVSDNPNIWYTGAEHLANISVASADVTNVDFGFSFNVVTTTLGGDSQDDDPASNLRSVQGSLRQFITNADTITGANAMRFVPVEPTDGTDGTNDWWTIPVTSALPVLNDADTSVSGVAHDLFTVTGLRNPNPLGPELELNGSGAGGKGLEIQGGGSEVRRLVINRFDTGIELTGGGNTIEGSYVGTDVTGTADLGNTVHGIYVGAAGNTIGGAGAGEGNVITGNDSYNVHITGAGATGNFVQGNYIGIDVDGTAALGGTFGVYLNAPDNTVGGSAAGEGNVISGHTSPSNNGVGIYAASTGNQIYGNYIGTSADGSTAVANNYGIALPFADNIVGGTIPEARNVISGNTIAGIFVANGSIGNRVQGNYIGTDASGTASVANVSVGVYISDASGTIIGGTAPGAGNVLSGNGLVGVYITDATATANRVEGNLIGTDASGTASLGNPTAGVFVTSGASNNIVGGATAEARNVISSNGFGVFIDGLGTQDNVVRGNFIGTDVTGTAPLGNSGVAVGIANSASSNFIGGVAAGAGNTIAFSGAEGVLLDATAGTGNAILRNAISNNTGLGIDLAGGIEDPNGVTQNDSGDPDSGPNDLLNYPVITSATEISGTVSVDFDLDVPNGVYRVEFFTNPSGADPSGNGEGEVFADYVDVSVSAGIPTPASTTFAGSSGDVLTATATEGTALPFGSTSEFSAAYSVSGNSAPTLNLPGGAVNYTEGDLPTVIDATATVSDPDSADFNLGTLTVDFAAHGTANDRLAIRDQGAGADKITVVGNAVYYDFGVGPVEIGIFAGGTDGSTPLVVTLDTDANVTATQALLQNITYENVSLSPDKTPRTLRFVLTDGDGGTSSARTKRITFTGLNAPLPHEYFVPIPDEQVRTWAVAIDQGAFPPSNDMRAVVSITVTLDGNRIVYDHWEDGLETYPENPVQATTEIWGDGRAATGCPPTKNRLPLACTDGNDLLDAGDVLALENDVPANPRGAAIRFDGGDLIASSDVLAVTRAGWPVNVGAFSGVVLAGSVEVYSATDWGVRYLSPVGEDIVSHPTFPNQMFEHTAFSIMAGEDATLVSVDVDGDGSIDQSATLDRGESLLAENVDVGGEVLASKPVQVGLLTGDVNTTYEARWFALVPTELWSSTYYTPVGETDPGAPVSVIAYNPAASDINVAYETLATSGSFTVPAGDIYEFTMPANSG